MGTARIITVNIIKHKDTGLLLGTSEEIKGLYVHGRSLEELESRIPDAIREILEASGKKNVKVMAVEDGEPPVVTPSFHAARSSVKFALAA